MAEPTENRAGLHKDISSVLKDVPIPQGVRDRRPGDAVEADRPADSSGTRATRISSVFKDVGAPQQDDSPQPADRQVQDRSTTATAVGARPAPATPQRSGQTMAEAMQAKLNRTADPSSRAGAPPATIKWPLRHRIHERLFGPGGSIRGARRKAIAAMVPIAAGLMVFAYGRIFNSSPQETEAAAAANSAGRSGRQIAAPPADGAKRTRPDASRYENPADSDGALNVRGVVFSEHKPSAVVGTQIVYVGDKIGDVTVVQINRDSVVFEQAGKQWTQKVGN